MIDLKFDHVTKVYRIRLEEDSGDEGHPMMRRLKSLRRPKQEFFAVRDVSFEVERGEVLGIIGYNGAGKSTILKLLSNITAPTSGEITINGRLSALIEVGSGFHPELTGRENVFLNGAILGLGRREIAEKLDSIVEFAGVMQFIDTPVKRFSSGMYVRLGFSVAAHLDPDILLLDEVLAVGDAAFQAKCFQRIDELRAGGKTIVFISHDLGAVERLCNRVLLIQRGQVVAEGSPRDVITEYRSETVSFASTPTVGAGLSKQAEITSIRLYDSSAREASVFSTGEPLTLRVAYIVHERVTKAVLGVYFHSMDGAPHCQFTTGLNNELINLEVGTGVIEFSCAQLGLQPGAYYINSAIERHDGLDFIDAKYNCVVIRVDKGKSVWGTFYTPHEWRFAYEVPNEPVTEYPLREIASES